MASLELDLLARVMEDNAFRELIDNGVDLEWFATVDGQQVYQYLKKYYHNEAHYGETPSLARARKRFATLDLEVPRESLQGLIDDLKSRKLTREMELMLDRVGDLLDDRDPEKALSVVGEQYHQWSRTKSKNRDIDISYFADRLEEIYGLAQDKGGMLGIPSPWAPFNRGTMGLQPGDFHLLYGRPGTLKTWTGTLLATFAYEMCARRVMFFSAEMLEEKIAQRISAILAGVDWDTFRHGELQPARASEVFSLMRGLRDMQEEESRDGKQPCLVITTGSGMLEGKSLKGIRARIEEIEPDYVVIDGLYLLHGEGRKKNEQVAAISNGLREMANELAIPITGITQANRDAKKGKGDDAAEVAYADALGQDATIAQRIIRAWDNGVEEYVTTHAFSKGRDGGIDPFVTHALPAYDFSVIRRCSTKYVAAAVKEESTSTAKPGDEDEADDDMLVGQKSAKVGRTKRSRSDRFHRR